MTINERLAVLETKLDDGHEAIGSTLDRIEKRLDDYSPRLRSLEISRGRTNVVGGTAAAVVSGLIALKTLLGW
jgi:hypothetical protein